MFFKTPSLGLKSSRALLTAIVAAGLSMTMAGAQAQGVTPATLTYTIQQQGNYLTGLPDIFTMTLTGFQNVPQQEFPNYTIYSFYENNYEKQFFTGGAPTVNLLQSPSDWALNTDVGFHTPSHPEPPDDPQTFTIESSVGVNLNPTDQTYTPYHLYDASFYLYNYDLNLGASGNPKTLPTDPNLPGGPIGVVTPTFTSAPEPSSLIALPIGGLLLLGLAVIRRRKVQTAKV